MRAVAVADRARALHKINNTQLTIIMGDLTHLPNFEPTERDTHTALNPVLGELGSDADMSIPDGSITTEKLANGAVSAEKLHSDKAALRNALGLGEQSNVTHAGYTVKALEPHGADIWLQRDSSADNQRKFWITWHGGTLYLRTMNDDDSIKAQPIKIESSGQVVFGTDVALESGRVLQLGQPFGPPMTLVGVNEGGFVTIESAGSLTFKAADGRSYKVPCWVA